MGVFHVVSLGAGVQSSTMLLMLAEGALNYPKPDVAIFADTGWEPRAVYKHLDWLESEVSKHGVKIVRTSRSNIREDMINCAEKGVYAYTMPLFTKDDETGKQGILMRQCTYAYKIQQIRRTIRQLLGYGPKGRVKEKVKMYLGISIDEVHRMKPSPVKYIEHVYPLVENGISRDDCLAWMAARGYPKPPKSACIGCPYHSDRIWAEMKRNDPESWADAVDFDRRIRRMPKIKSSLYLHVSRKPLDEVVFNENDDTDHFGNECEGMCGL